MAAQIAVIRATLKYSTQEELIRGMAPLISRRGLFIHTRTTRPTGSEVHFEFQLANGSQTYSGEGVVRKEFPFDANNPAQKPGMLISLQRINRPFKEVVDAIIAAKDEEIDAQQSAVEKSAPKQLIVDTRSGAFDFFGEMEDDDNMDDDLDSLFAGIEKKPTAESNDFDTPTVVNDLFFQSNPSELLLEYSDDIKGEDFDTFSASSNPSSPRLAPLSSDLSQSDSQSIQNDYSTQRNQLSFSSSLEGNRFVPKEDTARQNAVTGLFRGTAEELARAERLIARGNDDDSSYRKETKREASPETLAALSAFSGLFTPVQAPTKIEQPKTQEAENKVSALIDGFSEPQTPSALFEALHNEILGSGNDSSPNNPIATSQQETPVQPIQPVDLQQSNVKFKNMQINTRQDDSIEIANEQKKTVPMLNLKSQEPEKKRNNVEDYSNLTIESILKKDNDPIMQNLTDSAEGRPRERSPQSEPEMPTEKRGLFSNLFRR